MKILFSYNNNAVVSKYFNLFDKPKFINHLRVKNT